MFGLRPPLTYKQIMDKIRSQLSAHGLSESGLQVGNPYSGIKKSQESYKDREFSEWKKRVQKLENDRKPNSKPDKPGKAAKPDKPVSKLDGKLARTCKNWNNGVW